MAKQVTLSQEKSVTPTKPRTRVAAAQSTYYSLVEGARPVAGERLHSHTQAVFEFMGLTKKAWSRPKLETLMGKRAVSYHIGQENMAGDEEKVSLTPKGSGHFGKRLTAKTYDAGLTAAFLAAIQSGTESTKYGIRKANLVAHTS